MEANPANSFYRSKLSKMLREVGRVEDSIVLFEQTPPGIDYHRGFFTEWSFGERHRGNLAVFSWLSGISLSDGDWAVDRKERNAPDRSRVTTTFKGMKEAFDQLFLRSGSESYSEASKSVARIGNTFSVDRGKNQQKQHIDASHFKKLLEGLRNSHETLERPLPEWIPAPGELEFSQLARVLEIEWGENDYDVTV